MSIYDALGGEQGIRTAVDEFYVRVLGDPALAHYFTGIDMARLHRHQTLLLGEVTGGPQTYDGRALGDAHQHLRITSEDFDRVVGHLAATLTSLGVDDATLGQIAAALTEHRDEIVAEPASTTS